MKRPIVLLSLLSVLAACLGGCIISATPATMKVITLKVGDPQTFKVSGFMNGPYTWYRNDQPIDGATGASYTYTALLADRGEFEIRVQTKDLLNQKILSKTWKVTVVADLPPIAVAGPEQDLAPGATVQLDGGASKDPEEQSLTYLWEIVTKPAGSNATLSDPYIVNPTFTIDVAGAYTVRLTVNDGTSNSEPSAVIIKAFVDNESPNVEAGPDQTVLQGTPVTLDGSASIDPEGSSLTYQWVIESQPAGANAALSDPNRVNPTLTTNMTGQYVASLIVNDGAYDSGKDWVTITVRNTAPVANAGENITIPALGGTAQLDGSQSSDPDGTALSYVWTITSRPAGSTATLNNATSVDPTFTPDKKGAYTIKLVVSDGYLSDVDTVIVTLSNNVPVANAGADIVIPFGGTAQLNGSGSDPDGDPLTYAWTITQRPAGSIATLSSATAAKPTFKPDRKGTYEFQLIVTDEEHLASAPDTVTLTTTNHAPNANAGNDINLLFPGTKQLSGSGSDADGDPLTYQWTVVTCPGSTNVLSSTTSATPTFTPDVKGDYVFSLVVNDGEENSLADTVAVHVYNNQPMASAAVGSTKLRLGTTATLNGNASYDPDGTALSYAWTITTRPNGSTATLSDAAVVSPTFTPDKEGTYVFSLVVSDGDLTGTATVTLTVYTYYDGSFESAIAAPWGVSTTNGSYSLSSDFAHSGTKSYNPRNERVAYNNNNTMDLTLTLPQPTYVYSISCWMYREGSESSAVHSELYVNGSRRTDGTPAPFAPHEIDGKYHVLDPGKDIENIWFKRTWVVNAAVTTITFRYFDLWTIDDIYLDDIEINTWGN